MTFRTDSQIFGREAQASSGREAPDDWAETVDVTIVVPVQSEAAEVRQVVEALGASSSARAVPGSASSCSTA